MTNGGSFRACHVRPREVPVPEASPLPLCAHPTMRSPTGANGAFPSLFGSGTSP